jgi:hypothetical protein
MNNPGFYQNICLDLEISSLSISALLQLTKINEFDGMKVFNKNNSRPEKKMYKLFFS